MTKKDYIKLAQALKDSRTDNSEPSRKLYPVVVAASESQWKDTVETIAFTLQSDNPRFNRDRFLAACGYVLTE